MTTELRQGKKMTNKVPEMRKERKWKCIKALCQEDITLCGLASVTTHLCGDHDAMFEHRSVIEKIRHERDAKTKRRARRLRGRDATSGGRYIGCTEL
ncbi:hypothetical protein L1887_19794 [Cichorium endivia]|nr:hypothetical protein L1887_19794 [Cichorium endivia]